MAQALTRAMMRDTIRRNLNKETLRMREPNGAYGEPSSVDPFPDNDLINRKMTEAISFISRKSGFSEVNPVTLAIAAQTATGQYAVNLRSLSVPVNDVRRVSWNNGSEYQRLTPKQRDEQDHWGGTFENNAAGTPSSYMIEAYTLYLDAAPSAAGTLSIIAGTGIIGFETDNDIIEQLPNDFHGVVSDAATYFIADTQQNDSEMAGYAKTFQMKTMDGIRDIVKWRQRISGQFQATFGARRSRSYSGRR